MSLVLKSVKFLFLSWTFLCLKDTPVTSKPTGAETRCPVNESEWNERAAKMFCQGSDSYHCFLAEDRVSVKESCIEKTFISDGYCPIFTDEGYLHWIPCNGTTCPKSSYRSDETYKYQICLHKRENANQVTTNSEQSSGENTTPWSLIIGIVIGLVVLFVLFIVSVLAYRKIKNKKDEDVKNGLDVLETSDIVYVVGLLGNSVSTVGKEITRKHAKKNKMRVKYLNYLDLSTNVGVSDNTVYFVDGWFGLWNDNPCERDSVKRNLDLISQQRGKNANHKFVFGISSEIKKAYAEFFEENGVSFPHAQTILLDTSTKTKKEKVKSRLDALNKRCKTANGRKLKLKDISAVKELGPHLIINLVDLNHSLANVLIERRDTILNAMTEHFQSLYKNDEELFKGILYIVLNGVYDEDEFSSSIAEEFSITRENVTDAKMEAYTKRIHLNQSQKQKSQLAPTWSSTILGSSKERQTVRVFWHNFLYICAFRACYYQFPDKVMLHCNLDAILQLVRPIGQGVNFKVEADVQHITSFYEKRIKGVKALEDNVGEHPLVLKYRKEHA